MSISQWNINGTKFIQFGKITDKINEDDINSLPNDMPINEGDTSFALITQMATIIRNMGIENLGSFIGTGIDGRNVAQSICDCSFVADTEVPYSAYISSSPSTSAVNIFGSQRFSIRSNYVKKNANSAVSYQLWRSTTYSAIDIILSSTSSLQGQSYGWLSIDSECDPLMTNVITDAIKFQIYPSVNIAANTTPIRPYSYTLYEVNATTQRTAIPFKFYVDLPIIPTIVSATFNSISTSSPMKYFSGVARYQSGSTVNLNIVANNILSEFYNSSGTFAIINSNALNNASYILSNSEVNTIYANNRSINRTYNLVTTLKSNVYGAISATFRKYSAKPSYYSDQTVTYANITVDTNTVNESDIRVNSGSGLNPDISVHTAFNSTESLLTNGNAELQFIYNKFQYPIAVPSGPDYSLCVADNSGYRWVTFKYTSFSSSTISRAQLQLTNVSANPENLQSLMKITVKFNSSANWLNVYLLYISGGANEETSGIYDSVNNTYTSNITCGDSVNIDYVLVRIGISSLSPFSFERALFTLISE